MFVYMNDKLYVQRDSNVMGVNVDSHGVTVLDKETVKLEGEYLLLTKAEVDSKFNIATGGEYKFPVEEVVKPKVSEQKTAVKPKK
jgi:hypothetical protein